MNMKETKKEIERNKRVEQMKKKKNRNEKEERFR